MAYLHSKKYRNFMRTLGHPKTTVYNEGEQMAVHRS